MTPGPAHFSRIRAVAHAALEWERWAPALLPAALFLLAFIALALFGLWDAIGDPWRLIALLAALGGGAYLAWRALRRSAPVSLESTLRRVEQDSNLEGRPFEALTDAPAALQSDPVLWRAHVVRMAQRAANARAKGPRAALARYDTMALRAAAVVVVLVAVGVAGDRAPARIADAFLPGLLTGAGVESLVDAWVQPPDYTGSAPVFLTANQSGGTQTYAVPAGSELTVRISGVRRPPATRVRDGEGRHRLRFETLENEVHEAKRVLTTDSVLTVSRSGQWTIFATADAAPEVAFTTAPEPEDNFLKFGYSLADDYGVTALALVLELNGETDEVGLDFVLGGATPRELESELEFDLTEHRWAGQRVDMRLKAADAAANEGFSDSVEARIPQRIFVSPLAKAIAEQRQILLNSTEPYAALAEAGPLDAADAEAIPAFADDQPEQRIERAPEGVRRVADMLGATLVGEERYFNDYSVYLGLVAARGEVQLAREQAELENVPPLLWDIALHVETGDLADAEAALRAAERALLEAMARGADADELAQLFDAFEQAMNRYLEALAREAIEEGRVAEAPQGGGGQQPPGMDQQSVQDLLDAIREASELGDEAGARAALAQLTELLENMEMQIQLGGQGGGQQQGEQTPEQRAMQNALNELSDMIGEQRELMDDTLQEGGGEQAGQEGGGEQQGGEQGQQAGGEQGQEGGQPGGEGGQAQAGQNGQPGGQQGNPGQGQQGQAGQGQAGQGQPGQGQPGQGQPGQGQPGQGGGQNGQAQNGQGGQQNGQGRNGQGFNAGELASRQNGLADRLEQLGDQIGDGEGGGQGGQPGGDPGEGGENGAGQLLDRAREAMREAEEALRRGDAQAALDAQGAALDALRDGARQLADRQNEDEEPTEVGEDGRETYDPLGRTAGGIAGTGDGVAVPDEMERQRARDILEELRRRAGERRRPELELDYLRRLLERF